MPLKTARNLGTLRLTCLAMLVAALLPLIGQSAKAAIGSEPLSVNTSDLLIHGSAGMYWIARVEKDASAGVSPAAAASTSVPIHTYIQSRKIDDKDWTLIAKVNARVVSLANRGTQLATLFESGDWQLLWADGSSIGSLPTDQSKLTLLAGSDAGDLWAIASARFSTLPPTTAGATQPAATMPDGTRLLYRLTDDGWIMQSPLPEEARSGEISLCATGDQAIVGVLADGVVRVFQWNIPQKTWNHVRQLKVDPTATRVKLLVDGRLLHLWSGSDTGGGELFALHDNGEWTGPVLMALPGPGVPDKSRRDVALAGQSVRLVVAEEAGKLNEFTFSLSGAARGSATLPSAKPMPALHGYDWGGTFTAALLTVLLFNSFRRREIGPPEKAQGTVLNLAPIGRRLLAGAIDALPVFGTLAMIAMTTGMDGISEMTTTGEPPPQLLPYYIAVAVYLLHTLISEWLWGWTIGKRLCGLRVVGIDGLPAGRGAIFVRNLMRAIDVAMMFLPAGLILFTPLRQRLGDMAADTIVVIDHPSVRMQGPSVASDQESSRLRSRQDKNDNDPFNAGDAGND